MVIPRPLDDLEQSLPVASCWLEKPKPIAIPIDLKETQKELVELELPDLQSISTPDQQL